MKNFLSLGLVIVVASSLPAQVFRPETVNGAIVGGVAGAVIGNNSSGLRHNAWKGAAIGAGAGAVIGSAVGRANDERGRNRDRDPGMYVRRTPEISLGYQRGYSTSAGHFGHGRNYGYGHGYYRPVPVYGYSYRPYGPGYGYGYGYGDSYGYYGSSLGSGSAAVNGLWLGALAGGVIGHNSGSLHHNGWRGAAWGAGLGWLLGSVADARRTPVYQQPVYVQENAPAVQASAPQPAPAAQPVTIINNYYNAPAPMSSANSLFGR